MLSVSSSAPVTRVERLSSSGARFECQSCCSDSSSYTERWSRQNSFPSGSASTTQVASCACPTSARRAPRARSRSSSAAVVKPSARRSRCSRFFPFLGFGHPEDVERRHPRPRSCQADPRVVFLHRHPAEHFLPEPGQSGRIGGVDHHGSELARHRPISSQNHRRPARKPTMSLQAEPHPGESHRPSFRARVHRRDCDHQPIGRPPHGMSGIGRASRPRSPSWPGATTVRRAPMTRA